MSKATVEFTPNQEAQLAFCNRMEPNESVSMLGTYEVTCHTCHENKTMHSADGVRAFIYNHKGHETWVDYLGKADPLTMGY